MDQGPKVLNYNRGGPRKHPTLVIFLLFEFAFFSFLHVTWILTFKILGLAGPACSLTATFCIYSSIILLRKVCYSILSAHPLHPSSSFRLQPVAGRCPFSRVAVQEWLSSDFHRTIVTAAWPPIPIPTLCLYIYIYISRSYLLLLCQYVFHICFIFVSPIPHPCASFAT